MKVLEDVDVFLAENRRVTLADLIHGWDQRVKRFADEASSPPPEKSWGADEFFGALFLRNIIQGAIEGEDDLVRVKADNAIALSDQLLKQITTNDSRGLLRRFARPEDASGWWWDRLPTNGLPRIELEKWDLAKESQ